jgi:WD40 repeat protein
MKPFRNISLILSPKETKLFSASKDNLIKLWDLKTNKCLVTIKENYPEIYETILDEFDKNFLNKVHKIQSKFSLITKSTTSIMLPIVLGNVSNLVVAGDENGNI